MSGSPAVEVATQILGESIGFWVQTGAIILSIFVTGYYARKAILTNGESARNVMIHNQDMQRQRATIDLIIQQDHDHELAKALLIVARLPKNASFLDYLDVNDADSTEKKETKDAIRVLLNRYEFIALGIKYGAFEEQIYKELQYTNVMEVWKNAKPLIMELRRRKNKNTYYQEFELLAEKWGKDPLKEIRPS